MRLITKTTLWLSLLLVVALTSAFFNIGALRELRETDALTAQEYEIALNARRVRSLVFGFHHYSMTAAITGSKRDQRIAEEYGRELNQRLSTGLGAEVSSELQMDFEKLKVQIESLLERHETSPRSFQDPDFRESYARTLDSLDALVNKAIALVTRQRRDNEVFYRNAYVWAWVSAITSVIILLLGLLWFRQQVLRPIQSVFDLVERIRSGDLAAKWETPRVADEIGMVGKTLNLITGELEQRRRDRVEFVGAVAHDIRNPLTAISNMCQVAIRKGGNLEQRDALRMFDLIKTQVDRVARLTEDLLAAAKESRPAWEMQPVIFSMRELGEQVLASYRSVAPDRILTFRKEVDDIQIFADRERIHQVLTNLLSNAIKFSRHGTPVELVLGQSGEFGIYEVRDRGPGIPDREKVRVFDPFVRLETGKRHKEGAGLGLAIVQDIVSANSGHISVHDRAGGGSVFRVMFPIAQVMAA